MVLLLQTGSWAEQKEIQTTHEHPITGCHNSSEAPYRSQGWGRLQQPDYDYDYDYSAHKIIDYDYDYSGDWKGDYDYNHPITITITVRRSTCLPWKRF